MGQAEDAIRTFESLIYQDPNNPKLLTDLGIAYYETKRYSESERYLNQGLEKSQNGSGENVLAHTYLAKVYRQNKQPQKAISHFRAACASQPSLDCLKGLAQLYYEDGQWDSTIAALAQVLQIQKDDPDVYGTLAVALMQKGEDEKAFPLLREGLRYATDNKAAARFYQNTGHILLQRKQYDLAEQEFMMGVAKDFSNVDCHFGLALSCLGAQNVVGAKKALEDVLRIDPQNRKAAQLLQEVNQIMQQPVQMNLQLQGGSGQVGLSIQSKK